jgi:hypothetical protein
MQRFPAHIRTTKDDGHPVYDLDFMWKDNRVINGVRYTSWLLVRPETDPGKTVRIRVHLPDRAPVEVDLGWDSRGWGIPVDIESPGGLVSVVSLNNVPLVVLWELTAGKE